MNETPVEVLSLTVSEFSARIKRWFLRNPRFKSISICGEVADYKTKNGNIYFELKEGHEVLACFAYAAAKLPQFAVVKNGMAVIATGTVVAWERSSRYQLNVVRIEPTGDGALAAQIEALRKRLECEGAFLPSRKRTLPRYPQRIAVVSADGEGKQDFLTTLQVKAPNIVTTFFETRVQGIGAEIDIADAIDRAGRTEIDAIVVLRGGGSSQDRRAFDTETVVRAILRSKRPVVTAIGHQDNRHLADDVSDAVFMTPTAAAEHLVAAWVQAHQQLASQNGRLVRAIENFIARLAQHTDVVSVNLDRAVLKYFGTRERSLAILTQRLDGQNRQRLVSDQRELLASSSRRTERAFERLMSHKMQVWSDATSSLNRAAPAFLSRALRRLERAEGALDGFDPLRPLALGYAIVLRDGKAVRDAAALSPGDLLEARFERGMARTRVESVQHDG